MYKNEVSRVATSKAITGCFLVVMLHIFVPVQANEAHKKKAEIEDYQLWHQIDVEKVSPDGKWIAYQNVYEEHTERDVAFVASTESEHRWSMPVGWGAEFSENSLWLAKKAHQEIILLNISDGTMRHFKGGADFAFLNRSGKLIIRNNNDLGGVVVYDLASGIEDSYADVDEYRVGLSSEDILFLSRGDGEGCIAIYIALDSRKKNLSHCDNKKLTDVIWDDDLSTIHYLAETRIDGVTDVDRAITSLKYDQSYSVISRRSIDIDNKLQAVSANRVALIESSSRGDAVLLEVSSGVMRSEELWPQIWHYQDDLTYSERNALIKSRSTENSAVYSWDGGDSFTQITRNGERFVSLVNNGRHALISNTSAYRPEYKFGEVAYVDYYLVSFSDGVRVKIIENNVIDPANSAMVSVSPSGSHIAYYFDSAWWVYDIDQESHVNVTSGYSIQIDGVAPLMRHVRPYGVAGWSRSAILIYDKHDIWSVSLSGDRADRLSDGREKDIVYRILDADSDAYRQASGALYGTAFAPSINLENEVLLSAFDIKSKRSGFSVIYASGDSNFVGFRDHLAGFISYVRDEGCIFFTSERYDKPKEVVKTCAPNFGYEAVVVRSNEHHGEYAWGTSEVVHYRTASGVEAQAALIYPANFERGKIYPLVVNIYEKFSNSVHRYRNPSNTYNEFQVSTYSNNGYFVLLPDMHFIDDEVGRSALDSVVSAVSEVVERGHIDQNAIGLYGHSFGGYLAAFIVTQTDMFSAVVTSGAPTDTVGFYLQNNGLHGAPQSYHFERLQWRFTGPLHEMFSKYVDNSPYAFASNISTPILSIFGENDSIVDKTQAIQFYNLLRRMGKEHVLLMYPDEDHIPARDREKSIDAFNRVYSWFEYHLKGGIPATWIVGSSSSN